MTDDETFTPDEQATWDSMKAADSAPAPEPAPVAPVPEPEPAPAAVEPPATAPAPKEDDRIPVAVLIEERKEWQRRLAKAMKPKQPAAPAVEVPKIDPDNITVDTLKAMAQKLTGLETERQEQAELNAIGEFGIRHAAEFKKTAADFDDAYNHLRTSRAQQLVESGVVQTAQDLNAHLRAEEADILRLCARMNVNPAAFVYNLALGAGYAKAAPPPEPAPAPANGATERDPKTGQFLGKPDLKAKVEMAAKGQAQATNPVGSAGAGQGGPLDLRALANLDGDDFDKATAGKAWEKMWKNA